MGSRVKNDLRNCKFFMDNYGQYQIWSGLYPVYWQIPAFYTVICAIQVLYLFKTFLITYGTDDLPLCAEAIHFAIMISLAIIIAVNRSFLTFEVEKLFWAFDLGVHNYEETIDEESLAQMEHLKRNKEYRKKIFSRAFIVTIYLAIFTLGVIRPLFYYISGKYDNPRYDDGINRWTPVSHWYPFDVTLWPVCLLSLAETYYAICFTALVAISNTVIFLSIAEEIIYEFKVLTLLLKNVEARAEMVWQKIRFRNEIKKSQIWTKCLRLCLSHCVKHHAAVREVFCWFDQMFTYVLLAIFLSSIYMLCLSGILFAAEELELAAKLTFTFFLGGEIIHIFIFSWYGQKIQDVSEGLRDTLYFTSWYKDMKAVKHHLLMLQAACLHPLKLSVGGFADASMNTFGTVINSAYSYFNVIIQASK